MDEREEESKCIGKRIKDVTDKEGPCGGQKHQEKRKGKQEKVNDQPCCRRDRLGRKNELCIRDDLRKGQENQKGLKIDGRGEIGGKLGENEKEQEEENGNGAAAHGGPRQEIPP